MSGFIGPGDNGMQSPHLRGIGSQVGSPGIENSVALYVDGTYIGATTPALLGLSYVQQVEVLKGPQGTLFGRNTTGGLLQITTWDPSDKAEAEGELGYANYNTFSGSAYFNAPREFERFDQPGDRGQQPGRRLGQESALRKGRLSDGSQPDGSATSGMSASVMPPR